MRHAAILIACGAALAAAGAVLAVEPGQQATTQEAGPSTPQAEQEAVETNAGASLTLAEALERSEKRARAAFARRDADGDGQVTLAELPNELPWVQAFERLDTDDSGGVSFEEARKHFESRVRRRFERFDMDGDGVLTAAEVGPRRPLSMIDRYMARDGNGDGLLTRAELASQGDRDYFEGLHLRADVDGNGLVSRSELTDEYRRRAMMRDANDDGSVTPEEYLAGLSKVARAADTVTFEELDRNGDGRLTGEDALGKGP